VSARVLSVNVSDRKGVAKDPATEAELRPDLGLVGDAHAGPGMRQVSLLAVESIERQKRSLAERLGPGEEFRCPKGHGLLVPGAFAENLTAEGIELHTLPVGTQLRVGEAVLLEISRIGKECHEHCAIYKALGDCILPREGVFARVIEGGTVRPGDAVQVARGEAGSS